MSPTLFVAVGCLFVACVVMIWVGLCAPRRGATVDERIEDAEVYRLQSDATPAGPEAVRSRAAVVATALVDRMHRVRNLADLGESLDRAGISMTAQVTARDRITGKVVLDQEIIGFTLLRVGQDLVSSERQSLPLLAGDLARNVTSRLADGSW